MSASIGMDALAMLAQQLETGVKEGRLLPELEPQLQTIGDTLVSFLDELARQLPPATTVPHAPG
jgi:HPt (histidine-containing phosphotransfer) domain-containing protein